MCLIFCCAIANSGDTGCVEACGDAAVVGEATACGVAEGSVLEAAATGGASVGFFRNWTFGVFLLPQAARMTIKNNKGTYFTIFISGSTFHSLPIKTTASV
jgi:hypothetical protein